MNWFAVRIGERIKGDWGKICGVKVRNNKNANFFH